MNTLDNARSAIRARLGVGARFDDASAPALELSWARLGTAYFARALNHLSDQELSSATRLRRGGRSSLIVAEIAYQARALAHLSEMARAGDMAAAAGVFAGIPVSIETALSLPAEALRHLFRHSEVHLNVEWRDMDAAAWSRPLFFEGIGHLTMRETVWWRAQSIWLGALELNGHSTLRDLPPDFRRALEADALRMGRHRGLMGGGVGQAMEPYAA